MPEYKFHPGVAAVLSFIFNGLGHIYVGRLVKGLFLMLFSIFSMIILIIGALIVGLNMVRGEFISNTNIFGFTLFICGLAGAIVIGIYSIFDSYNYAKKIN